MPPFLHAKSMNIHRSTSVKLARKKAEDVGYPGAFCEISRRSGKFTRRGSSGAVDPDCAVTMEQAKKLSLKIGCSDPCGEAASPHHRDSLISAVSSIGHPDRHALVPFFYCI